MKKGMKYLSLILVIILLGLFIINVFSPTESTSLEGADMSEFECTWWPLFVSWFPLLLITALYIVFLKYMKKLIGISERIATSLEKISDSEKLKS